MSNTAGMDFGNLQNMLDGLMGQNQVVGQETPQWEFPMGEDRVPESVRSWFLRSDAGPSRLNEFLQKASPEDIDKFRSAVNMGVLRPKNQAAQDIASSYGGLRAGDRTPLGPTINGMPSGMNPEYWAQYNNLVQTGVNYQLGMLDQMGYFNNMPTLERQQVEAQIAQSWVDRATNQFNALETQRNNMAQNGLTQQQIDHQNIQKMSELFGGQMVTDANGNQTFQPTEAARQFDTTQSGWLNGQRTLAGELQDWNMQKDVAQAASNPRDYIYAQMLGNARGGLAGMPATNQLQMPQQGMQPGQMPAQFGGQYNQLQNLATMQGLPRGMTAPGGQMGQAAPVPTPQAAAQGATPGSGQPEPFNPADQTAWRNMLQAGNQQWQGALQGMQTLDGNANWGAMMPNGSPATFGQQSPQQVSAQVQANQRYPGVAGQYYGGANANPAATPTSAAQQRMQAMAAQPTQSANGQQPITTSAFSQALMQNRAVPQSGAMSTQGAWTTPQALQSSFNPNKIRTQDYMRGRPSEQAGFQAVGSLAGYSEEDLTGAMKGGLPKFNAPGSARMI